MSYPLIILGAGASNGCLNEEQKSYRKTPLDFPLVNKLFNPQYFSYLKDKIKIENLKNFVDPTFNKEIIDVLLGGENYLKEVSARLMNRESLEKEVSNLWKTAKGNNEQTQRQLIAFSFYLQFLFYFLSEDAAKENIGGSSYDVLASEITDSLFREGIAETFIINFNYDLLMQKALEGINDKVTNRIHYEAIHGSCNNCWILNSPQVFERLHSHRDRIEKFGFNEFFEHGPKEYNFLEIYAAKRDGKPFIPRPVLTLPFFEKQEYNNHRYNNVAEWFKHVDKILVIGWSAKDADLIELISKNLKDRVIPLTAVAKGTKDIENIFNKFPETQFKHAAQYDGFNEFVRSQSCKNFFGTV